MNYGVVVIPEPLLMKRRARLCCSKIFQNLRQVYRLCSLIHASFPRDILRVYTRKGEGSPVEGLAMIVVYRLLLLDNSLT